MSYIGGKPSKELASPTSQYFNGDGSTTVFTLNRPVNVSEDLDVFVSNVRQEPGVGKSYTAAGTSLTFDAAPPSGTANVYVVYRGLAEITTRLEHDANAALAATTGTFSGDLTVDTNTLYVDSTNNRVGVGTASPIDALEVNGGVSVTGLYSGVSNGGSVITTFSSGAGAIYSLDPTVAWKNLDIGSNTTTLSTGGVERLRVDSDGLKFNGDTAAANALDDYEEGTFSPTIAAGVTSPTYTAQSGYYTKIGDIVYTDFYIQFSGTGNGGHFAIGSLPFNIGSGLIRGGGTSSYQNVLPSEIIQFYGAATNNYFNLYYGGSSSFTSGSTFTNQYIIGTFIYKT